MGKKLLTILLTIIMIVSVSACGKEEPKEADKQEEQAAPAESKSDLPYGTDTGSGTMYLATAGGTTEDGNIPDVLSSKDTSLIQIEIRTSEFDRSSFSFVYIDGVLLEKFQFGDSQQSISLEKNSLAEGEHTVSVVQYDSNDESGNIITYKEAKYNIVY